MIVQRKGTKPVKNKPREVQTSRLKKSGDRLIILITSVEREASRLEKNVKWKILERWQYVVKTKLLGNIRCN